MMEMATGDASDGEDNRDDDGDDDVNEYDDDDEDADHHSNYNDVANSNVNVGPDKPPSWGPRWRQQSSSSSVWRFRRLHRRRRRPLPQRWLWARGPEDQLPSTHVRLRKALECARRTPATNLRLKVISTRADEHTHTDPETEAHTTFTHRRAATFTRQRTTILTAAISDIDRLRLAPPARLHRQTTADRHLRAPVITLKMPQNKNEIVALEMRGHKCRNGDENQGGKRDNMSQCPPSR